ncbi:MAG TPA: hypothetical protein DEB06_11855 [Phycisphaerales bacterium]|nr:hypothetical protein [Phycisphaerales bacterium]
MAKRSSRKKSRRGAAEAPLCNCALLCDDVVISQGRGKHSLDGVIGSIFVPRLPAVLGGYVTYIRLTNIYRNQKVTVSLDHADSEQSVFEFEATLPPHSDPLGICTLIVPIRPFGVTVAGRYIFSVKSNRVPLAQSPISIQTPSVP